MYAWQEEEYNDVYPLEQYRAEKEEGCLGGGIVIYMLFMDTKQHNKPHVHVYYGDYEATVGIDGEHFDKIAPNEETE